MDKLIKTSDEIAGAEKFLHKVVEATAPDDKIAVVEQGLIDRTGWPSGPWDGEPDIKEWFVNIDGIRVLCLALRTATGAWVGHVVVPRDHFWHFSNSPSVKIPDENDSEVFAHGYPVVRTERVKGADPLQTVCGETFDCTVAFDCVHTMDLAPFDLVLAKAGRPDLPPPQGKVYRPLAYVMAEVELLAQKLVDVEKLTRRLVGAITK